VRHTELSCSNDRVGISNETAHKSGNSSPQGILVDGLNLTLLDHHPPVNDDALNAASGFGIHELPRGAVIGQVRDIVEIDENQIGAVARTDGAELAVEAGSARIPQRRVAQHLVRQSWAGLRLADSCQ